MSAALPLTNSLSILPSAGAPNVPAPLYCEQKGGLSCIVEEFITNYFVAHEGLCPSAGLYDRVIQEVERPLLRATLKSVKGNQKKAAEILGMNRNTLRKKLAELQIDPQIFQSSCHD
jgi:DNA-binding protein Fis